MHTGSRSLGEGSKTEAALYIPPLRKEPYTEEELLLAATADIIIDDDRYISYTNEFKYISYTDEFKYLGSLLEKQLNDIVDINARIKQAKGQFQAMRDNLHQQRCSTTRATAILQCSHRQHSSVGMRKLGAQIITDQKTRIYAPQLPSSNRWA